MKTENLEKNTLDSILQLQSSLVDVMSKLGELHLRNREIEKEQKRISELTSTLESEFDKYDSEFASKINEIRTKYPNCEIDLKTGTITYE